MPLDLVLAVRVTAQVNEELLLLALATPSVSTATAAVQYRHRLPVMLLLDLNCSCLLTSKSCDDPEHGRPWTAGIPRR